MYAIPLPSRPNVEQYKKIAKDLHHACQSNSNAAIRELAARWPDHSQQIEHDWHKFKKTPCTLARAQFFLAREHGFLSWPKFVDHVEALARAHSPVSNFEAAVDAIVDGDLAALANLLSKNPDLVRARSTRDHRSTLLHYVSANGVEDFRQKTPKNIVEVASLLLNTGADVNAESDAYGGRSTPLNLTATSVHPEHANVQIALMEVLIERGARIGDADVRACLANGRGQAAEFLANHGARLDFEGAAGVGRLDIVKDFFNDDGSLKPAATERQMSDGFAWACEYGRSDVIDFLLHKVDQGSLDRGLHWAAFAGDVDLVKVLLRQGAPVDVKDETHKATPLGWALYAWSTGHAPREGLYQVAALLVAAGATVEPEWLADEKIRADPKMLAAIIARSWGGQFWRPPAF